MTKKKIVKIPPILENLPPCFGKHGKKDPICRDCWIVESCYAYKEM
jgi:hypothetical protein